MDIKWYNDKPKDGIITLYDSNITLNKTAVFHFETAYSVIIGFDYTNKLAIIKPLSKELSQRVDMINTRQYKITVRSSYGRISNKEIIHEIETLAGIDLSKEPRKYSAKWDNNEKFLVIDLKREE